MDTLDQTTDCYDTEDECLRSPGLTPVIPQLRPSRAPSPFAEQNARYPSRDDEPFYEDHPGLAQEVLEYLLVPWVNLPIAPESSHGIPAFAVSSHERQGFTPKRLRLELPMIIKNMVLNSRPDSGSEENIIAAGLVSELDLEIDTRPEHQKDFRIANGKVVKSLGRILIACAFAKEPTVQVTCFFYVFKFLISPIIMGIAFLDQTETLSRNRHRLQPRITPRNSPLQLYNLNNPKRRLICITESQRILATADTGSEVDLVSSEYATERKFRVRQVNVEESKVQFADGTIALLEGKVDLSIVLGHSKGPRFFITFYVIKDLTCDLLLGEDILNETDAFKTYREAFSVEEGDGTSGVNAIVWLNSIESILSRFCTPGSRRRPRVDEEESSTPKRIKTLAKRSVSRWFNSEGEGGMSDAQESSDDSRDDHDAREIYRRELSKQAILKRPQSERVAAWLDEQKIIDAYEEKKAGKAQVSASSIVETGTLSTDPIKPSPAESRLPNSDSVGPSPEPETPNSEPELHSGGGPFPCKHERCSESFQTQYLLNSHANIHSEDRAHYCPVKGCARSEGGKGFKRKNEMIRHNLVHRSPGFVCPFCPDREHKYPRPDNLQRHVRVNHLDVSPDHPRLREVLDLRPSPVKS